jgi:hypothetical protein
MKFKLSLLFISILLFSTIVAADFQITAQQLQESINIDQQAKFLVTVKNNDGSAQDYRLTFGDVGLWDSYSTNPLSDYFSGIYNLQSKKSYTTTVILKPIADIGVGYHTVTLNVKEVSSGIEQAVKLPVYIRALGPADKEYLPFVKPVVQMDKRIDPRNDNVIRVVLLNKNRQNLTNVVIRVESNIITETVTTDIEPLGQAEVLIPIKLDPLHPPEEDTLYTTVTVGEYTFKPDAPIKFEIIDYSSQFLLEREEVKGFLMTTEKRSYINDGNVPRAEQIKIRTTWFQDIFRSSEPKPELIINDNNVRYRAWNADLAPGEKFDLVLYTSYRILFYIAMLGCVGYYFYLKMRSPILIMKEAKNVEMREGGISEVKVLLNVKNISNLPIEHISVIEKVPNIANLSGDYDVGTIRPSKIMQHANKGSTIVQWDIDELDAHEERLIVYRIRSKLSILGKFGLPLSMVKFSTKNGKTHKVFSNRLVIGK